MHLVNLDTLTCRKKDEGLDIQRSKIKNRSLHASLAMRLYHNPTNLWGNVLNSKYSNLESNWKKGYVSRI